MMNTGVPELFSKYVPSLPQITYSSYNPWSHSLNCLYFQPWPFGICCMPSVSRNTCCDLTWFFSPCWLLLGTATYYWDLIQTYKQVLHFYFMCLFPSSQLYDITWSFSSSWSCCFSFIMFLLHGLQSKSVKNLPCRSEF